MFLSLSSVKNCARCCSKKKKNLRCFLWLEMTTRYWPALEPHSTSLNEKVDAKWRPLGPSGVCGSDVENKTKKKRWFLLLKCPRPTLHTPRGAPLSSSSSRLIRLDIPSLSWQADTEDWSLVVFVLYSWLCFVWLTALGSLFFFLLFIFGFCIARNSPWNLSSVFHFHLRSQSRFLPQVPSRCLFSLLSPQGDISCYVCVCATLNKVNELKGS